MYSIYFRSLIPSVYSPFALYKRTKIANKTTKVEKDNPPGYTLIYKEREEKRRSVIVLDNRFTSIESSKGFGICR